MWNHKILEGIEWYKQTKIEDEKIEKIHLRAIESLIKLSPTFFFWRAFKIVKTNT